MSVELPVSLVTVIIQSQFFNQSLDAVPFTYENDTVWSSISAGTKPYFLFWSDSAFSCITSGVITSKVCKIMCGHQLPGLTPGHKSKDLRYRTNSTCH